MENNTKAITEISLAHGEEVLRRWDYAQSGGNQKDAGKSSLIVTNKRIISAVSEKQGDTHGLSTQEIAIDDVKSVSGFYSNTSTSHRLALIICLLLAAATFCIPFLTEIYALVTIPIALIIIGVVVFFRGGKSSKFYLYLTTRGTEGTPMEVSANILGDRKNKTVTNIDSVEIDPAVAQEIVASIGAIVLDHKSGAGEPSAAEPTPKNAV